MNHYSDCCKEDKFKHYAIQVLRTTAEENILSGTEQIKIFVTLFKDLLRWLVKKKEMSEIIWEYLGKKISLINSQN